MSYSVTKNRVVQWIGIILILAVFAGAYWYFKVYGSTLNAPQNDLNTNGLIGLWSFNGDDISGTTAYDRSGAGNTGTLTNGPTKTIGIAGQALSFDGSNDYVDAGNAASVKPSFPFTVSASAKFNSLSNAPAVITSSDTGGTGQYAGFLVNVTSSGQLIAQVGGDRKSVV